MIDPLLFICIQSAGAESAMVGSQLRPDIFRWCVLRLCGNLSAENNLKHWIPLKTLLNPLVRVQLFFIAGVINVGRNIRMRNFYVVVYKSGDEVRARS